jgi:hypothetical protein
MEKHTELNWWCKCPLCGFSCVNEELCPADKVHAERDPLMPHLDKAGVAVVEKSYWSRYKWW